MASEQQYYEYLARTDHPVYRRDFAATQTAVSPFNSILNRVIAKQFVSLRADIDEFKLNRFPHTTTASGIDAWEQTYFGFTSPELSLEDRIVALLIRINTRLSMSAPAAIAIAEAITGQTPTLIRSLWFGGWVLGQGVLGLDTFLSAEGQTVDSQRYILRFDDPLSSRERTLLDEKLTQIEKGGSRHIIVAPNVVWVLGQAALSIDTTLG